MRALRCDAMCWWLSLYVGAAEMAQGRGWWRKWRGAVAFRLFAPTHMGCFLLYHLYPFSDFFLSKLIDSVLVGSNLFNTRAEVLERLPREVAPSRGFHPREAFLFITITRRDFLERQIASRGK